MGWNKVKPNVNEFAEFLEIAGDFGDPLEVVREAISNAYDAKATEIKIKFSVKNVNGYPKLIIEFEDNGEGMTRECLVDNFWALGNSKSKDDNTKIGEKGHGTKIYLRSDLIYVRTKHQSGATESICENAFKELNANKLHTPEVRECQAGNSTGTYIRLEGYNNNERSKYLQDIVKDYIYWFTKLGSFETQINDKEIPDFKVKLQCIDATEYEILDYGHKFPNENNDIHTLFELYDSNAAEYYVKKYEFVDMRLDNYPEVKFDAIIYFEGNEAKKEYNTMLKKRKSNTKGYYKVADRYGIWLCKDYIPVQTVNHWISGFGNGSNSFTLLHGFINCQNLRLTANRGSIANTDPSILNELKNELNKMLDIIDADLYKNEINTLQKWQVESKTLRVETAEYNQRKESLSKRRMVEINQRVLLEPTNESELFGLFMSLYTMFPEKFEFEPLDYNTKQGIDLIARNKSKNKVSDCEYWYIELKHLLGKFFNHSFDNIRWIICWDFEKTLKDGTVLTSIIQNQERSLRICGDKDKPQYFLDSESSLTKIKIIKIKDFIEKELGHKFKQQ